MGTQDHQGTQGPWESRAVTVLLAKTEWQAYQGKTGSQVKRVSPGLQAKRVLQGREVDQGPLVVEVTTLRMHNP